MKKTNKQKKNKKKKNTETEVFPSHLAKLQKIYEDLLEFWP